MSNAKLDDIREKIIQFATTHQETGASKITGSTRIKDIKFIASSGKKAFENEIDDTYAPVYTGDDTIDSFDTIDDLARYVAENKTL